MRFRALLLVAALIAVGGASPYSEGRLAHNAYAEVAGTPASLGTAKSYFIAHGWQIDCEGRVGAEATMRVRLPVGTEEQTINDYFAGEHPGISYSAMVYRKENRSSHGCASGAFGPPAGLVPPAGWVPPIAADVTGMEPQLAIIRRDAAERRWPITCEGHQGEERVLRLSFPKGVSSVAISTYFDPRSDIASSETFYFADHNRPPLGCDHEPVLIVSDTAMPILVVAPRAKLLPLVDTAKACGFPEASVRNKRADEAPMGIAGVPSNWAVLDAGEDAAAHHGPLICFLHMSQGLRASYNKSPN